MTLVGIGWYKKDQWQDLRRVAVDKDKLEETWEEWAQNAERAMTEMMKKGFMVQKVSVDVVELELWCRAKRKVCAFVRARLTSNVRKKG